MGLKSQWLLKENKPGMVTSYAHEVGALGMGWGGRSSVKQDTTGKRSHKSKTPAPAGSPTSLEAETSPEGVPSEAQYQQGLDKCYGERS